VYILQYVIDMNIPKHHNYQHMVDSLDVGVCCKLVCIVIHFDDIIDHICSLALVAGTRGIPSYKVY